MDTSAHKTHEDGKAFDVRPLRNKASDGKGFTWKEVPPYHQDWTIEIIRTILRLYSGSIIYFNDDQIYDSSEFRGKVISYPDHDNHLHITLPGGARGDKEGK